MEEEDEDEEKDEDVVVVVDVEEEDSFRVRRRLMSCVLSLFGRLFGRVLLLFTVMSGDTDEIAGIFCP